MKRLLCVAGLLIVLAACVPPAGKRAPEESEQMAYVAAKAVDFATLTRGMLNLPGAEVLGGETPVIRYREPILYLPGAVLPRYRSLTVLDALAARLKQFPGNRWQVTVRAESRYGKEHALQLAQARLQLLRQDMERAGVGALLAAWRAEAGKGPVLELVPQSARPDSSSGVKR